MAMGGIRRWWPWGYSAQTDPPQGARPPRDSGIALKSADGGDPVLTATFDAGMRIIGELVRERDEARAAARELWPFFRDEWNPDEEEWFERYPFLREEAIDD